MKNKAIKTIVICVVIVGIGFGCIYGYNAYFPKKAAASAVQYYAVSTKKMNLEENVQGTGAAYSASTKDVAPNNSGTLKDLNVKVGDTVAAGQKLYVSDSDDIRKSVTSAQNNLTKQNLTLSADENAAKVDDNKIQMDNLSISDAKAQLSSVYQQLNKMTVTSSIGGVVTAVNNTNGDSVQSGKAVLTIVDMNSIKIKVAVDELDINKIASGQKAVIKFDAIKDKTYEGSVETIAQTGTVSNNVTTYDVVVNINNPAGIKLGMNANVTIAVNSKDNALVIPAEALIESNGQKYVRVQTGDNTSSTTSGQSASANTQSQNVNSKNGNQTARSGNRMQLTSDGGKLTAIKTGMETQNYIEITEGLSEGDKVLVQLPQASSTANTNNRNAFGGSFGGNMGGQMYRNNSGTGAQNRNTGNTSPLSRP